ncbi:Syntaxin-1A [Perkinsus olseni]|uniref:Syntaxin-1A n=1 Tax=Perkinsus olseni TaxID=32597 RepID=A0A7J6PMD7_PEROL|nr:Syntaxin-1A [Perkinsus olseni]
MGNQPGTLHDMRGATSTELDAQGVKYDTISDDTTVSKGEGVVGGNTRKHNNRKRNKKKRMIMRNGINPVGDVQDEDLKDSTLPLPSIADFKKMSDPVSVVFYQHGLWGHPYDLHNMAYGIYKRSGALPIMIQSNIGKTSDGVVPGGLRLLAECIPYFDALPKGSRISFLGHSLGGLYIRVALRNLFEKYPDYFTSRGLILDRLLLLACPNLGIRDVPAHIRVGAALGALAQQSMVDFLDSNGELLEKLCDYAGIESIKPFRERLVYGNLQADLLVSADSALIVPPGCKLWLDETYDACREEGMGEKESSGGSTKVKHNNRASSSSTSSRKAAEVATIYPAYVEATDTLNPLASSVALNSISWRRYAVKFPMWPWAAMFDGSAHFKLVNHTTQDIHNCGVPVVNHISRHWKRCDDSNDAKGKKGREEEEECILGSAVSSVSSDENDEVEMEIEEKHAGEPFRNYCTCINGDDAEMEGSSSFEEEEEEEDVVNGEVVDAPSPLPPDTEATEVHSDSPINDGCSLITSIPSEPSKPTTTAL